MDQWPYHCIFMDQDGSIELEIEQISPAVMEWKHPKLMDGWTEGQMDARMDRRKDKKGGQRLSYHLFHFRLDKNNPMLHKTWQCQTQNRVNHSTHTELIFDVIELKPSILNFQRAI